MNELKLELGVKTDPIEYRYSFPWLFKLLADEGVRFVQLGSFFEVYQLPDEFFIELRQQADEHGIKVGSLFTAHRELGGFFREEPGFESVARRNFERFIEVGGLLGADSVGSNPGAVMRDRMQSKSHGTACYVRHMKELMTLAHERGVKWLTIEPMSCLAEPPTLPEEIREMADELVAHHRANSQTTANVGYCVDIAHGYVDAANNVVWDNIQLLEATLPYLYELHLKNTDAMFNSTFGFTAAERERGIVDVAHVRDLLLANAEKLPVRELVSYLEIGGPKLGRDYSDHKLEGSLRESLRYLRETFIGDGDVATGNGGRASLSANWTGLEARPTEERIRTEPIRISPSMMCADQLRLLDDVRKLEAAGVHLFHIDIMDGHFAPNLSMSLPQVEQLRRQTNVPLDVHLMVENNDLFVELLSSMSVEQVAVHVESCTHLDRTLAMIRDRGMKAGAAINPHTPPDALRYVLDRLDYVLVMTVNPGFAGQKLVPSAIDKIADVGRFLNECGCDIPISVDGNVSFENIPAMVEAGADMLVAGTSSIFHKDATLAGNVAKLNAAVAKGLERRSANSNGQRDSTVQFHVRRNERR
jgi:ribulose-phosphate 3-epimerase